MFGSHTNYACIMPTSTLRQSGAEGTRSGVKAAAAQEAAAAPDGTETLQVRQFWRGLRCDDCCTAAVGACHWLDTQCINGSQQGVLELTSTRSTSAC